MTEIAQHLASALADRYRIERELGGEPGPRILATTRSMAPTGRYSILSANWEMRLPRGLVHRHALQHGSSDGGLVIECGE